MPIVLTRSVTLRFSPDDYRQVEAAARSLGITLSQLIRSAALGVQPPRPRRRPLVDQPLLNQLQRLGNLINQLTRLQHELKYRGQPAEAESVRRRLDQLSALLGRVAAQVAEAQP